MRVLLLLVLILAVVVSARDVTSELSGSGFQWGWAAVQSSPGYASPVATAAVGSYSSLGVSPVAWSASLYLLPSPFDYGWLLGNGTIGAELGESCLINMGPMRYAMYFPGTGGSYVDTPSLLLGQNFTIVAVVAKPYRKNPSGGYEWLWIKLGPTWYGEASVTVEWGDDNAIFRVADSGLNHRSIGSTYVYSGTFRVLAFVGTYSSASNTYTMQIYVNGVLQSSTSFSGQRYTSTSTIRIGAHGGDPAHFPIYVYAFLVYNKSLTNSEIVAIYTWPLSPTPDKLVLWYLADPAYFNGTHWLDLSGNNRHGRVYGSVRLVQTVEPVYTASRCGYVDVSARWDGFTASFTYSGQQVAATFVPGYVWFNGRTQYGTVPITFYGWTGLTIEQYVYIPPCKPNNAWSKTSMYGIYVGTNNTYIMAGTSNVFCYSGFFVSFGYRNTAGVGRDVATVGLTAGKWQHVVITFNKTTLKASIYVNGTLRSQGTWEYNYTIFDYRYSGFYLGSNVYRTENTAIAYAYVRIYSRELSQSEIQLNLQNPNSPVTNGLEVWLHWDSYNGTHWLDKSGKGRHATLYGGVMRFPPLNWRFGLYLRDAYPQATPVVVGRLTFNWTSSAVATWGQSGFSASAGTWDSSRASGSLVARVAGAYVDAGAVQGLGSASFYLGQQYSLGVSGKWTQSDDWRGWLSLFSASGLWLNITQIGGHGVAAPGQTVRGYAGAYALTYSSGSARLYANSTQTASWQTQLPTLQYPLTASLLVPSASGSGLRALLYYMWLSPGVKLTPNGSSTCGSLRCTLVDHSASYPQEQSYYVDFRWSPPVSTWGVLSPLPAMAREGGSPGRLTPAMLTGAVKATSAIWGPFGEVCPGRLSNGTLISFGVRYVWMSSSSPTCSVPLQTAPSTGTLSTVSFNATASIQLTFSSPPIQHPLLANSVPGARFCSLDARNFTMPYLPVEAPGSTVVTDQWACAPSDYFVGGYVGQSQRGWALIAPVMRVFRLNTTSVIYFGSGAAVLALGSTVPALSVEAVDGRAWHIYTSGAGVVASVGSLQTPPNISRTGGVVSAVFGVPRAPTTLISQWWADGVRYYISAAGLADAPVVYISSFTGSPVAIPAELNAPQSSYNYYLGIIDNGTYVWAVPLTGPMSFSVYVPAPGYYTVRLYRGVDKVWEKNVYLSPDTKLTIGPIDIPVFTPVNPVSLVTPAAPKPPVFVPAISMTMPPYAVGILMLGVFAAAYVSTREISLASLITGAVVTALGVLISTPILGVAGVFLLAFGLWNKSRRQSQ
jgi:branched-subunit amino acid transport protein AzlD